MRKTGFASLHALRGTSLLLLLCFLVRSNVTLPPPLCRILGRVLRPLIYRVFPLPFFPAVFFVRHRERENYKTLCVRISGVRFTRGTCERERGEKEGSGSATRKRNMCYIYIGDEQRISPSFLADRKSESPRLARARKFAGSPW